MLFSSISHESKSYSPNSCSFEVPRAVVSIVLRASLTQFWTVSQSQSSSSSLTENALTALLMAVIASSKLLLLNSLMRACPTSSIYSFCLATVCCSLPLMSGILSIISSVPFSGVLSSSLQEVNGDATVSAVMAIKPSFLVVFS